MVHEAQIFEMESEMFYGLSFARELETRKKTISDCEKKSVNWFGRMKNIFSYLSQRRVVFCTANMYPRAQHTRAPRYNIKIPNNQTKTNIGDVREPATSIALHLVNLGAVKRCASDFIILSPDFRRNIQSFDDEINLGTAKRSSERATLDALDLRVSEKEKGLK
jgi:hypothetical protein